MSGWELHRSEFSLVLLLKLFPSQDIPQLVMVETVDSIKLADALNKVLFVVVMVVVVVL